MKMKSYLQQKENTQKKGIRVRDHCHITDQYRGSTHQGCNINFQ